MGCSVLAWVSGQDLFGLREDVLPTQPSFVDSKDDHTLGSACHLLA